MGRSKFNVGGSSNCTFFCHSIYKKFYKTVNVRVNKVFGDVVAVLASHSVGIETLLVNSCYRNRDKLRQCGPVVSEH